MAEHSAIEWTDATWNPITGCSLASPGCTNCYAMRLAGTRLAHIPSRSGLTKKSKAGPVWTGEVRFNEDMLFHPLKWRKPRMIFVCAHGDLFHENVPDEWIDQVFAIMASCPQHIFQVLTKRSQRMLYYLNASGTQKLINDKIAGLHMDGNLPQAKSITWPLPNVWLGVSVENQARANERIPDLLKTPAAVRWISAEPLLGPIHIMPYFRDYTNRIDWVICGGESGPGARPMHLNWPYSLRDKCRAAGVPFFMKQMGGPRKSAMPPIPDDLFIREFPTLDDSHE